MQLLMSQKNISGYSALKFVFLIKEMQSWQKPRQANVKKMIIIFISLTYWSQSEPIK